MGGSPDQVDAARRLLFSGAPPRVLIDAGWVLLGADLGVAQQAFGAALQADSAEAARADPATLEPADAVAVWVGAAVGQLRILPHLEILDLIERAHAMLGSLDDDGTAVRLRGSIQLVESHLRWLLGDEDDAQRLAAAVADAGPPDLVPHALVAGARSLRSLNEFREARSRVLEAWGLFDQQDASNADRAGATRELTMLNRQMHGPDHEEALTWLLRAQRCHTGLVDEWPILQYGLLELRGRYRPDAPEDDDAYAALIADASALGSPFLSGLISLVHAQALQSTVTPRDRRWNLVHERLAAAETAAIDPLTRGEIALARAALAVGAFDPDEALRLLDEASGHYRACGNRVGLASVAKLAARALLRPSPSAVRSAIRLLRTARAGYAAVGMEEAERVLDLDEVMHGARLSGFALSPTLARELLQRHGGLPARDLRRRALLGLLEGTLLAQSDESGDRQAAIARLTALRTGMAPLGDARLTGCINFVLAEALAADGRRDEAVHALRSGLDDLAAIQRSLPTGPQQAWMAAAFEAVTSRALEAAAVVKDREAGLLVLEWRRSGGLAGLLRRRGSVTLAPETAAFVRSVEQQRAARANPSLESDRSVESVDERHEKPGVHESTSKARPSETQLFMEIYDPSHFELPEVLRGLADDEVAWVVDEIADGSQRRLVSAYVTPDGPVSIEIDALPTDASRVLQTLSRTSDVGERPGDAAHAAERRRQLTIGEMLPISRLLPSALIDMLQAGDRRLVVIPGGRFWCVPFGLLPLVGDTLVWDLSSVTVAPSLRVRGMLEPPPTTKAPRFVGWRGPDLLRADEIDLLAETTETFDELLATGLDPSVDGWVLAAHGTSDPGLLQSLHTQQGPRLAWSLLGHAVPPVVQLGACFGAHTPGVEPTEPLGLATILLACGASAVIAPTMEYRERADQQPILESVTRLLIAGERPDRAVQAAARALIPREGRLATPAIVSAGIQVIGRC